MHEKLEIGSEVVKYICSLMYPLEALQSCGMSNFGHVVNYKLHGTNEWWIKFS